MKQHDVKAWPEFFQAVRSRQKTFEIRLNDRDYKTGDLVNLREWIPDSAQTPGRHTNS